MDNCKYRQSRVGMGYLVVGGGRGICLETNMKYEKKTKLSFPWEGARMAKTKSAWGCQVLVQFGISKWQFGSWYDPKCQPR